MGRPSSLATDWNEFIQTFTMGRGLLTMLGAFPDTFSQDDVSTPPSGGGIWRASVTSATPVWQPGVKGFYQLWGSANDDWAKNIWLAQ